MVIGDCRSKQGRAPPLFEIFFSYKGLIIYYYTCVSCYSSCKMFCSTAATLYGTRNFRIVGQNWVQMVLHTNACMVTEYCRYWYENVLDAEIYLGEIPSTFRITSPGRKENILVSYSTLLHLNSTKNRQQWMTNPFLTLKETCKDVVMNKILSSMRLSCLSFVFAS